MTCEGPGIAGTLNNGFLRRFSRSSIRLVHDSGAGQLRQLDQDLFQALLGGLVRLPAQFRDDGMSGRAIWIGIRRHGQTKSMQVLDGELGHVVIIALAGLYVGQRVDRPNEGGTKNRKPCGIRSGRAERRALNRDAKPAW